MAARRKRKAKKSSKKVTKEELFALEKRIERQEKKIEAKEEKIAKEEKEVEKLEKQIIFKVGNLKVTKKHVFDIAKVTGGALLGTGLGLNLVGAYEEIAAQLPWAKIIGLLAVSLILATLMLYQEEKEDIKASKNKVVFVSKRLAMVYIISFLVVSIFAYFFSPTIPHTELLVKILFLGSFSAISGAITFSLF